MNTFNDIDEDEYVDLEATVFESIEEIISDNILKYSNPTFYEKLVDAVFEIFFEEWLAYGLVCEDDADEIHDMIYCIVEDFFEIFEDEYPKRSYICTTNTVSSNDVVKYTEQIEKIRNYFQPKQRTTEWYEYRHNLITASSAYKILGSVAQVNSFIYEKCKPFSLHHINYYTKNARQWGNIYEPLTIKIYENRFNTRVEDFGCIQHPAHTFLGASPDGINVDPHSERYGRMIEVKNIYNRDITGIPKEDYWIQMQIQMETCDLNECDFIETRFKEYSNESEFYEDESQEYKGVILCFINKTNNIGEQSKPIYEYIPLDVPLDKNTVDGWIDSNRTQYRETHMLYSTDYWYLDEFSCILVKRNKKWFDSAIPKIEETWKIVEVERVVGCEHRAAKKRVPSQAMSNIYSEKKDNDDKTQVIHNVSVNSGSNVCLIKLDSSNNI